MQTAIFTGTGTEWDSFVRASNGWTHFHLHGWRDILAGQYHHDCPYLVAREEDGRIAGVLPLVRVRSRLFGHYLVSMPYVNYGGPLGSPEAIRALVDAAAAMAKRGSVRLLELRCRGEQSLDLPVSHRKVTVLLDLPETVEGLSKHIGSKVRSQVKRPQKEGVEVKFGPDQVDPFFEVFARHMRDLGTPTQPRSLFVEISERFGKDVWFGCAWYQGNPIAAGAGFRWHNEFEMTWASALQRYSRLSANMLLYFAFMERCIDDGASVFNFGRCSVGSGTHRFKQQWGTRDQQLWWYHQAATASGAKTPSPDDGAYSWGPRIWRRLPLKIATAVGPHIVRSIP